MQQYDDPTTVGAQPAAPAAGAGGPGWFTDGAPGSQAPTRIRAWFMNLLQAELLAPVLAAGLVATRTVQNQLLQAIRILSQGLQVWTVDASPTANLVVAVLAQMPATLSPGQTLRVKIANTNTSTATLTFGGMGNAPILCGGAGLSAGQLQAGVIYEFVFDGQDWQVPPMSGALYAVDSSATPNLIVAVAAGAASAIAAGTTVRVKVANTNTAAATLTFAGAGNATVLMNGHGLLGGELMAGVVYEFVWDGVDWQVLNGASAPALASDTSTVAGTIIAALASPPAALRAGLTIRVKIANTLMGPTNLTLNALGNYPVKLGVRDTEEGDLVVGSIAEFAWDAASSVWRMMSASCRFRQTGLAPNGGANGDFALVFPSPFPNKCFGVFMTMLIAAPAGADTTTLAGPPTQTGATVHRENSTSGTTNAGFYWIAEGY